MRKVPLSSTKKTDDQILPFAAWVPIGKSNFVLDLQKKQKNPSFRFSMLTIFQLDETRFILDANLLREALEITPIDQAHQVVSPPSGDAIMDFAKILVVPADSSSSIPADNVPAGSSSSIPAEYVSAGHTQQYPNNVQSQQFQQFQTASISANNAKFPYLEKDKYEIWAMKMEYWIQNADHNLWRIVQQGNSPKRLGKDAKGNTIVHPPVSLDEHVAVQRENKVRTLLLQALPEDHMPDFHHYDDARDIWIAVKARFGGNEESKKMRKTMLKTDARPDNDDINLKFLRALPSSCYGVKAAAAPTHSAFIGAASSRSKSTYSDQQNIASSVSQTSGRSDNIMDILRRRHEKDVNYNNQQPARFDRRKVRCYKCLQLGHFARECNVKTVDDKARYSAFKVTEVKTDEPKALVSVDSMVNWSDHAAENKTGEVEKVYGMMAGLHADNGGDDVSDVTAEFAMMGISPKGDPSTDNDIGIVDSGCSRSMTGNKEKLDDFVQIKGGIVKFGGGDGRISGKGTIRTSKLDFENVYYVEELQHFNLFSVSQICDKKNKVLFTDTDCLVLSEEFQLPDENQVVLRIPREHDLYTFRISDLQPEQKVTCLVAKASLDESTRWHRRMAHVNFKTINKLAKEGLVDGLPLKVFTNETNVLPATRKQT
ncbi:ribonuclease H-like domain-containing protein [Tanacetum coccineum]